jgi:hypothetical protein
MLLDKINLFLLLFKKKGADPVTDLRGVGMLSIRLLNFFAKRYPSEFAQASSRSNQEYTSG